MNDRTIEMVVLTPDRKHKECPEPFMAEILFPFNSSLPYTTPYNHWNSKTMEVDYTVFLGGVRRCSPYVYIVSVGRGNVGGDYSWRDFKKW